LLPTYFPEGVSVATDPRGANLDPYTSEDQTDKLQWWIDSVCKRPLGGKPAWGYLPAGRYRKSAQLLVNPTDGHRPTTLRGAGSTGGADAPTMIVDEVDTGPGTWSLDKQVDSAGYEVSDISFYGLVPSLQPKGHPGWAMRGVHANSRCHIFNLAVAGYQCGIGISGDHHNIHDCIVESNVFGIEVPPGQDSQGDIKLYRVWAGGCSKAGLGVAGDSPLAGMKWVEGSGGNSPYLILRYDSGTPLVGDNWMIGVVLDTIASEFCGNGVVYDAVQDGAGITGVKWLNNTQDYSLYDDGTDWSYNGESRPKVAAWYNAGPIDLEISDGFPTSSGGRPAIKGGGVSVRAPNSGRSVLTTLLDVDSPGRPIETTGSSSGIASTRIGTPNRSKSVVIHTYLLASGSIARGELLTNSGINAAVKYSGGADQEVIGVAITARTAGSAPGNLVEALLAGHNSDCQVKNTSGVTIAADKPLKPHPGGGVQAATGASDPAQIIGRAVSAITDGALGQAELWIA
jgi:hypothetical protein